MQSILATYNILHPEFAIKHSELVGLTPGTNESNWQTRKVNIVKGLVDSKADIICLQEVSQASLSDLSSGLTEAGFAIQHVAHPKGDGLAIVYKKAVFSEVFFKSFELDADKKACFIDLRDESCKKVIRIANCHLQGGADGPTKGVRQLNLVLQQLASPADYAIDLRAVLGDFNEDATREHKKSLLSSNKFISDGAEVITEPSKNRQIDWIYCSASENYILTLQDVTVAAFTEPASDHRMKATQVTLANR